MTKPIGPIKWSGRGLKDGPHADLCTLRPEGYYDIVRSDSDGWTVLTPFVRWSHDGAKWQANSKREPPLRGVLDAVTREEARLFAESLIREWASPKR